MPGNSQHDYRDAQLDQHLLSTLFRIQTNWHVITGASCSGKTTLIDHLADKGFQTFPEVARQYFERELAEGRTISETREDRAALTSHLYGIWVKFENGLQADKVIFLDRALPDSLTFYRFTGLNPNDILPDCFQHRYASVFMLNRLPYLKDGVRAGDDAYAAYFDSWMTRDYSALGYNVIRVPVLTPEERLAFILDRLPERGPI